MPLAAQTQQAAHFVGTWTTALMTMRQNHHHPQFDESILVQTVRVSAGGGFARLGLSNIFGESELIITSATLSRLNEGDLTAFCVQMDTVNSIKSRKSGVFHVFSCIHPLQKRYNARVDIFWATWSARRSASETIWSMTRQRMQTPEFT